MAEACTTRGCQGFKGRPEVLQEIRQVTGPGGTVAGALPARRYLEARDYPHGLPDGLQDLDRSVQIHADKGCFPTVRLPPDLSEGLEPLERDPLQRYEQHQFGAVASPVYPSPKGVPREIRQH